MSLKSKLCMFQSEKNKLDGMAHHIEVRDAHCDCKGKKAAGFLHI